MTFLSPINRAFTIESVSDMATPIFEEKGIRLELLAGVGEIDAERKVVITDAFEEHPYDLLICVPPHRGAQVVIDSGLAPKSGWLPTDRHTLQVKTVVKPAPGQADEDIPRYPNVYALGDATDLPLSKAGSTAHFEAPIVAERVAAAVQGREPEGKDANYTGKVMCFFEVGDGKGTLLQFDYDNPPKPPKPEPDVAPRQDHVQQDLLAHRAQGVGSSTSARRRSAPGRRPPSRRRRCRVVRSASSARDLQSRREHPHARRARA